MEVIFDNETRKQLIGLLPFDEDATDEYTPAVFDSVQKEYKPVFIIRPLKQGEKDRITILINKISLLTKDEPSISEFEKLNSEMYDIARMCIVGLENLIDIGNSSIIEYVDDQSGGLCKKIWSKLPKSIKSDIYYHVNEMSGLFKPEIVALKY